MLATLLAVVLFHGVLVGASPEQAAVSDTDNGQNIINLDEITINKAKKEISIKTHLAIESGILEYLLVAEAGKAYESAFKVLDAIPSQLNAALLLIGCEPMAIKELIELADETDGIQKLKESYAGSLVTIDFLRDGQPVDQNKILEDREQSSAPLYWVFTGGAFTADGRYLSDLELSFIALWPDQAAVINLFSDRGNPYGGEFGFQINEQDSQFSENPEYELMIRRYIP